MIHTVHRVYVIGYDRIRRYFFHWLQLVNYSYFYSSSSRLLFFDSFIASINNMNCWFCCYCCAKNCCWLCCIKRSRSSLERPFWETGAGRAARGTVISLILLPILKRCDAPEFFVFAFRLVCIGFGSHVSSSPMGSKGSAPPAAPAGVSGTVDGIAVAAWSKT